MEEGKIVDLGAERRKSKRAESLRRIEEIVAPAVLDELVAMRQAEENANITSKDFYEVYNSINLLLVADKLNAPLIRRDALRLVDIAEHILNKTDTLPQDIEKKIRDLEPILKKRWEESSGGNVTA